MGSFFVNFHVQTSAVAAIDGVLAGLDSESRRTEPGDGWVSVYEARASSQDPVWITELACRLSVAGAAPTVAFLVHDSDLMQCWLAEDGAVQSHIDSWPGFPETEPSPTFESPDPLIALCQDLDLDGLNELFRRDVVFAEDLVHELAKRLGIDPGRALVDFHHDDVEGEGGLGDMKTWLEQQLPPPTGDAQSVELVEAAHAGDIERVRALLDAGASPEGQAPWRPESARSGPAAAMHPEIAATSLFAAASENHPAVIRLLLDQGADPNGQIPLGSGPLVAAACSGHLPTIQALLAGGADPLTRDAVGMTAAEALAAARQQVDELRAMMGDMASIADLPMVLPDDDALEACARALEEAQAGGDA